MPSLERLSVLALAAAMRRSRLTVGAAGVFSAGVTAALAQACITSSPAEYGVTPSAKRTLLALCERGMIDDAEDGDAQVTELDGRDGYWFTFVDPEGSQVSPQGKFEMSPGGRPGNPRSEYAARMSGKIAEKGRSLYAGIGFSLVNPKSRFDLSRARGVRFWAKGPGRVRFKIPDVNTDPAGDRCTRCYNDFGVDLYLSDKWERYTVPFSALEQQPGWGDRAPHLATGAVMAIQWQFSTPGEEFDIAIDDVALVGCSDSAPDQVTGPAEEALTADQVPPTDRARHETDDEIEQASASDEVSPIGFGECGREGEQEPVAEEQ